MPVLLVALAAGDALLTQSLSIPTSVRIGETAQQWKGLDALHSSSLDLTLNGLRREASSCEPEPTFPCLRNDQHITKIPVFHAYSTDQNPYHLAMVQDPVLKETAVGAQRIWFAREVAEVAATERMFAVFRSRVKALGVPPLVVHSPDALGRLTGRPGDTTGPHDTSVLERLPAAERTPAEVVRYGPTELVLDVDVAAPGWLLVTDRWARGWRAEVNGAPTVLYGGNFLSALFGSRPAGTAWSSSTALQIPLLLVASWGTLAIVALGSAWRAVVLSRVEPYLPCRCLISQDTGRKHSGTARSPEKIESRIAPSRVARSMRPFSPSPGPRMGQGSRSGVEGC